MTKSIVATVRITAEEKERLVERYGSTSRALRAALDGLSFECRVHDDEVTKEWVEKGQAYVEKTCRRCHRTIERTK